jgi:hypothetical protein
MQADGCGNHHGSGNCNRSFHAEARRTAEGAEACCCSYYGSYNYHCNYHYDRTGHYRNVFSRGGAEARGAAEHRQGSLAGRAAYTRALLLAIHDVKGFQGAAGRSPRLTPRPRPFSARSA